MRPLCVCVDDDEKDEVGEKVFVGVGGGVMVLVIVGVSDGERVHVAEKDCAAENDADRVRVGPDGVVERECVCTSDAVQDAVRDALVTVLLTSLVAENVTDGVSDCERDCDLDKALREEDQEDVAEEILVTEGEGVAEPLGLRLDEVVPLPEVVWLGVPEGVILRERSEALMVWVGVRDCQVADKDVEVVEFPLLEAVGEDVALRLALPRECEPYEYDALGESEALTEVLRVRVVENDGVSVSELDKLLRLRDDENESLKVLDKDALHDDVELRREADDEAVRDPADRETESDAEEDVTDELGDTLHDSDSAEILRDEVDEGDVLLELDAELLDEGVALCELDGVADPGLTVEEHVEDTDADNDHEPLLRDSDTERLPLVVLLSEPEALDDRENDAVAVDESLDVSLSVESGSAARTSTDNNNIQREHLRTIHWFGRALVHM